MAFNKALAVIDVGIEDYQTLVAGVVAGTEVVILDRHQDGIEQITQALSQRPYITSLHIVSHGSPGCLYLGDNQLSLETIDRYTSALRSWPSASTELSSITLYGCNIAAGDAGAEFVKKLHQTTGADIVASTTRTGHAALGANWDLDYRTIDRQPQLAFGLAVQTAWMGALPGSSFGTEFWLAFPRNYNGSTSRTLYISGTSGTTGTVEVSGISFSQTYSIGASGLAAVSLPANAEISDGTVLENKGVHVTSSADVGVYGLNFQTFTADAYTGFPVDALGTDYLVISNTPSFTGYGDQITVVGTQDNTSVTLTPQGGSPTAITLNKGQVYQFESNADLTGASVTSSAPVAVFTGNQLVRLGAGAGDFTVEQLTPTQGWDDQYLVAPTPVPERHRILASTDGTVVKVDGTIVATLNRGQFYEYTTAGAHDITASAPILVAKLIEGTGEANGDPALVIMQSPNNFINKATFATPTDPALTRHTVTIVTSTADTGAVLLDGAAVSTTWTTIGSSGYSWTRVTLTAGEHKLASTAGFGATVYGDGNYVSYAYVAGSNVLGAPPLAIDVSSDTGISNGDNITNDTTPTFSGIASTGKAGDTITIYSDGVAVGTGVLQSDRSWSVTVSVLTEGTHAITSTLTSGSKQSAPSSPVTITIDTTKPTTPTTAPKLDTASDTGVSDTDNKTNITTPLLTGVLSAAEAGYTIKLYDGSAAVGTATVAADGSWSVTTSTLSAGDRSLTYTVTDIAGNESDKSTPLTVQLQTAKPATPTTVLDLTDASDTGASKTDNLTGDNTPTFQGSLTAAEAGYTINLYNGSALVGTGTVAAGGSWQATSSGLDNGAHTLTYSIVDAFGNESDQSSGLVVTVNAVAPAAPTTAPDLADASDTGTSNTDNLTALTTPTFSGTGTAGQVVYLYDGGTKIGEGTVDANGAWSITASELSAGEHSITSSFVDSATGNESKKSSALSIKIDGSAVVAPSAPKLESSSGGANSSNITKDNTPTLTGSAEPGSTIQLLAGNQVIGTATVDSTGKWVLSPTAALADGTYDVTVKMSALEVIVTSPKFSLTIDTKPASVAILDFGAKVRDTTVNALKFQFSESVSNFTLSDVVLTLGGKPVNLSSAALTTTDNQTWTLANIPGFTQTSGDYRISIKPDKITDRAGNIMQVGTANTWITGYTADALALPRRGGKPGMRRLGDNEKNRLEGGRRRDTLRGLKGNDSLSGKKGNDRLVGDAGDDRLNGDAGNDRLVGGKGRDRLNGGKGNDFLLGGARNDRLVGGTGNDTLNGGLGKDILTGGAGKDTYVVTDLKSGNDRVNGFSTTDDLIDLRSIFKAPQFAAENRFDQYYKFTKLVQVGANTEVQVDIDGKGNGTNFASVLTLQNTSVSSVHSNNFVVG